MPPHSEIHFNTGGLYYTTTADLTSTPIFLGTASTTAVHDELIGSWTAADETIFNTEDYTAYTLPAMPQPLPSHATIDIDALNMHAEYLTQLMQDYLKNRAVVEAEFDEEKDHEAWLECFEE